MSSGDEFLADWDIGPEHCFPLNDFAGIPWPPKKWNEKNEKISRRMLLKGVKNDRLK